MQSAEAEGTSSAANEVAEAAAVEAAEGVVVVSSAPQQTIVAGPVMEERASGSPAPSTRTCQQENGKGVKCILNGAEIVISVPNPLRVHGRTSTPQDHSNETGTSPVLHKISYFSILYTKTNTFRKYME